MADQEQIAQRKPLLIAEVKTESPYGFRATLPWPRLFDIANEHGDWISVHTDPRWGGSLELVTFARKRSTKPILAKGPHFTGRQIVEAIDAGADHVLALFAPMPRVTPFWEQVIWEPMSYEQLVFAKKSQRVVWNQRDIKDGTRKLNDFDEARLAFRGWLCQASFIRTRADVHPKADAILVGEHLAEFVKS